MLAPLDPRDPLPLYAQLARGIRSAIAAGRLRAGERLPTVRELAVDLRVNANTVARVYAELERSGVLETRRGVGTFVREPAPPPAAARERERTLRALGDRAVADAHAAGIPLRELVRHLVERTRKEKRS